MINIDMKKEQKQKVKYWYKDNIDVCVLCGKETHFRERVFSEKDKGTFWKESACYEHF
jgi:hypothetical protein